MPFCRFFFGWEPTKIAYSKKLVPTYSSLSSLEDLAKVSIDLYGWSVELLDEIRSHHFETVVETMVW